MSVVFVVCDGGRGVRVNPLDALDVEHLVASSNTEDALQDVPEARGGVSRRKSAGVGLACKVSYMAIGMAVK